MSESAKLDQILDGIAKLDIKTDNTNRKIEQLTQTINGLKTENLLLKDRITKLEEKLDYQENQMRRNNVIVYNLEENDSENWNQTEEKVKLFVKGFYEIELTDKDVERAHRLGNKLTTKTNPRPVVVKFSNFKIRDNIIRGASKLKGSTYAVSEDFSQKVKEERKALKPYLQQYKEQGRSAHLRFNKLVVDGKVVKPRSIIDAPAENQSLAEIPKNQTSSGRVLRDRSKY